MPASDAELAGTEAQARVDIAHQVSVTVGVEIRHIVLVGTSQWLPK